LTLKREVKKKGFKEMSCAPTPKLFCLRVVQSPCSLVCYSRWSPIGWARENFRFICL